MNVQIDKSGRIVLPKLVRDRLGLQPGTALLLEETQGGIFLKLFART